MNRIDRLTAILLKLQSKSRVPAEEIAAYFDISVRTVYRDLRALGEAGVPIGAEPGKGYFIVDGYYVPPVMFTKDEASAMLMAGKLIEKQGDRSVRENFDKALLKVKAVLKNREKDYLQNLEPYIDVINPGPPRNDDFPDHFISDIKNALVNHHLLSFDYYASYRDEFTSRSVEPIGLCFYSGNWHLIAYCRLREAVRDFRTDRITKLRTVEEEVFDHTKYGDYLDYVHDALNGQDLYQATIQVTSSAARYINEQKYFYGFVSQTKSDKYVTMTFMVAELDYFARWLMMFGNQATVLEPKELRDSLTHLSQQLSDHLMRTDVIE